MRRARRRKHPLQHNESQWSNARGPFDRGLFTLDGGCHLLVDPTFETESALLKRTLHEQTGTQLNALRGAIEGEFLAKHNEYLDWA